VEHVTQSRRRRYLSYLLPRNLGLQVQSMCCMSICGRLFGSLLKPHFMNSIKSHFTVGFISSHDVGEKVSLNSILYQQCCKDHAERHALTINANANIKSPQRKRRSWSFNIQSQVTATSSTQPSYMLNTVIPKNQSNAYTGYQSFFAPGDSRNEPCSPNVIKHYYIVAVSSSHQ
jgi:hypothetical protein